MTSRSSMPEAGPQEPAAAILLEEEARMAPAWRGSMTALALLLVLTMLVSLSMGAYPVPLNKIVRILVWPFGPAATPAQIAAIRVIRLPRILLAALAGGGLGISGAGLQGIMRNPLIGPDTIGISSGAVCGGLFAILFDWPSWGLLTAAFTGGFVALIAAFSLARLSRGGGVLPTVLAGVVVTAFFTAIHGLIQYTADPENKLPTMIYWLVGSFSGATLEKVVVLAPAVLLGGAVLFLLRWRVNLLSLGDTDAATLGVKVGGLRWTILAAVALIVAAQVAVSGIVGWVGLIVPHFARMLIGPDHRRLLPASALVGAIFLLMMDDVTRVLTSQELPIGILTAVVGTPAFALLFWRTQSRGWVRD
jgi:iron complex transport system permease protein